MRPDTAPIGRQCRVVLMDDHNLVRHGVASLLRLDGRYLVVGEASNGEEGLQLLESVATDLVLLDLSMPRLNGIETMRRMAKRFPRIRVLVLSMYNDEQFVAQTLKDGARGYILKNAMDGELFQALETVLRGNRYVSPSIDITNVHSRELEPLDLTVREREVLQLIVEGHTTLEIADMLTISPHTAAHHRSNLMQKLDAHSQIELVQIAAGRGLVLMPRRL